jgi:tetratricopeptide (TPR) repeat protein
VIQKTWHDRPHVSADTTGVLLVAAIIAACDLPSPAVAADACEPAFARVVSVQGSAELRRPSSALWQQVRLNDPICAGDMLRVGERSRAGLLLNNETTLRLDQNTTLTLAAPDKEQPSLLDLVSGVIHVISRTPRPFRVKNKYLNAAVQGTEFLVGMAKDSARVAVYEGRVTAENELGSVAVGAGEQAVAAKGAAPRREVLVRPRDAVQWTLYFPAIFDYSVDYSAATAAERTRERSPDARSLIDRAGLLLLVGRLDEARADIGRALTLNPRAADAYALQAVIAVVQNDKDEALKLAEKAVDLDPASPAARIALSYAQQARFKIEQALATARKAVDLSPQNALAWARLAELEMSTGDLDHALDAAKHAAQLNPDLAKTQTVLGFAFLARIDTRAAKAAFNKAIQLDPADPLPRLGLGLAIVREGDLKEGREQIEIATSLDPDRSLIRSYLGKAYYEEKRDKQAATQFEQAKERDPLDPTPWLYDAIREQSENRPVEALQDLEKSIELNGNRGVYRSQLLLDQDEATRRVNQARIYRDLGFEQLALVEAYKSLAADPGSDSAHRLLADAYSDVERGDITRVSEALQAQLRQPVAIPSVDLLLNSDNLFILRDTGPFRLGVDEFSQLYDRDQIRLQADGIAGTQQTRADLVSVSGLSDKVGYAVSQLHYGTDGFRDNNEVQKDIYDAFVQAQISADSTAQLDIRRSRFVVGQTFYQFDPTSITPTTLEERSDSVRVGGHWNLNSRLDLIWSANYEDRDRTSQSLATAPFSFTLDDAVPGYAGELQSLLRFERSYLISGIGYVKADDHFSSPPFGDVSNTRSSSINVYTYGLWNPVRSDVTLELGLAGEFVNVSSNFPGDLPSIVDEHDSHRISPKFGVTWTPTASTTVRAAAFSAVKRAFVDSQTIEPTQVAGFNQFFAGFDRFYGDEDGTVSRRACFAIDQKFSSTAFAGGEISVRRVKVPFLDHTNVWEEAEWREKAARVYLNKAFGPADTPVLSNWQVATSVEYQLEEIERPAFLVGPEGIENVETDQIPFAVRVFNSGGVTLGATARYVRQGGVFVSPNGTQIPETSSAWIGDLFFDYRLPRRLGVVSVGAKNLFDRSIDLFETDPTFLTVPSRRFVYARVRVSF